MRRAAWRRETVAVHAGFEADAETGAVAPPIYQTSTFMQDGVGRSRGGWEYARTDNPTRAPLECAVAELQSAVHGLAFSSGSAATAGVGELGEELVVSDDVHDGTFRYFERVLAPTRLVSATPTFPATLFARSPRRAPPEPAWCGWRSTGFATADDLRRAGADIVEAGLDDLHAHIEGATLTEGAGPAPDTRAR